MRSVFLADNQGFERSDPESASSSEWSTASAHRATAVLRTATRAFGTTAGMPRVPLERSLATVAPDVAAQWHPTKNGAVGPDDVVANSHKKFWFKCGEGSDHEWEATLGNRVSGGQGCPCCAGQKVSVTNSFESLKPWWSIRWCTERNDGATPDQFTKASNKKFYFVHDSGDVVHRKLSSCKEPPERAF